jgi:thiamine-phosphate pyrophosphorylase
VELVRVIAARIQLPWFAIGGLNDANLDDVLAVGARRVAVVRAVAAAPDPRVAAAALLARMPPLGVRV